MRAVDVHIVNIRHRIVTVPSPDTTATDPAERVLRAFVRTRVAQDHAAMEDAWARLVTVEMTRIRGLVGAFRHDALPGGMVPHVDREDVVQNIFLRLRDPMKLEGSSIGEVRAFVRTVRDRACQDYVRTYVRDDKRRAGSLDHANPSDGAEGARRPVWWPATTNDDAVQDAAIRTRLVEALPWVDENKREVVVLMLAGVPAARVAAHLGLTRSNVYQLNKRGLSQLRRANAIPS